ncbi:MAG: IS66 family transposase [Rhodospirillaceae bacterium]
MLTPDAALPDDLDALKALVAHLTEQVTGQARTIELQDRQIETLRLQLAALRRRQFGRRSEKLQAQADQLELQLEELEARRAERQPADEPSPAPARERTPKAKPVRKPLPADLPREEVRLDPPYSACPGCGGGLRQIGEDVTEVLEHIPARFLVKRYVRPVMACRCCEDISEAPPPALPIPKGNAAPSLLAEIIVSKYDDHLPLYRQAERFARDGLDLPRSTLADWMGRAARLLDPLAELIAAHVLGGIKIHGDDTPVPVLEPGRGKTRTGRLWVYVRDDRPAGDTGPPAALYRYSPDRKGEHPTGHLARFTGFLQADAYAGFAELYKPPNATDPPRVIEVACWAHVRRKFFDLAQSLKSPMAQQTLTRIAALYTIEDAIRGQPPDHRRQIRQAEAVPPMAALHDWLEAQLRTFPRKSAIAEAIRYALTRWPALTRYLDDGRLENDNNTAERAIRAIAIGRKNWLFAGSDDGGKAAATFYTLIETAKLNGREPRAWLAHALDRIARNPSAPDYATMMPWAAPTAK